MRILGIDPGPTTGLVVYDSNEQGNKRFVGIWHEDLEEEGHSKLWYILSTVSFDTVVCEKFEFRKDDQNRDKIDYLAAELVGVVKAFCQTEGYDLVMQGSSLIGRTAFWSDDNKKVKQLGLYRRSAAPHGMDALRHVLYYLSFTLNDTEWFEGLK